MGRLAFLPPWLGLALALDLPPLPLPLPKPPPLPVLPPSPPAEESKPPAQDSLERFYGKVVVSAGSVLLAGGVVLRGDSPWIGLLAPGMAVEVEGQRQGQGFLAQRVRILSPERFAYFQGPAEALGRKGDSGVAVWTVEEGGEGARLRRAGRSLVPGPPPRGLLGRPPLPGPPPRPRPAPAFGPRVGGGRGGLGGPGSVACREGFSYPLRRRRASARPQASTGATTFLAARFTEGGALPMAMPIPTARISSRSFSPSPTMAHSAKERP